MNLILWGLFALTFYYWGAQPMIAKGYGVEVNFVAMVMTYFGLLSLEIRSSIKRVEVDTIAMRKQLDPISHNIKLIGESIAFLGETINRAVLNRGGR